MSTGVEVVLGSNVTVSCAIGSRIPAARHGIRPVEVFGEPVTEESCGADCNVRVGAEVEVNLKTKADRPGDHIQRVRTRTCRNAMST